ncbi:hypothetical protein EJ06DRAFT_364232 [Trichodelitschia bisporula]|uniref:DUF7624 domain-containing protein n=1 Tax=Trichodelitschia bisporula TaxID=703511 RepID=A0A6G1I0M2_9PEZI|nr:hypothetical protein EJ06DRAFT_364232 [Trichodelitschia bisporula]
MALTTTLMHSPTFKSAFSPYTDSPSSPAPFSVSSLRAMNRASGGSDKESLAPPPSPYPATVDPSPVESIDSTSSQSTDVTDIDQDQNNDNDSLGDIKSPDIEVLSPSGSGSGVSQDAEQGLPQIDIMAASHHRVLEPDEAPQSVIHAPAGFKSFIGTRPVSMPVSQAELYSRAQETKRSPPVYRDRAMSTPSEQSEQSEAVSEPTVVSPSTPESNMMPDFKGHRSPFQDATSHNAKAPPGAPRHGPGGTPRVSATATQEAERRLRMNSRSLEDIAEADDRHEQINGTSAAEDGDAYGIAQTLEGLNSNAEQEVATLKAALSECWTLCNTLAGLSSMHRERMFSYAGSGDVQENAWKSCWKLCQKLYEGRDEDHTSQVRPLLELCRDFCQSLFEARMRSDPITDSILRVSFELNNHLYNTHDRNLPDAFRERTLDFYLTLCHRLMKQRTSLPEETDSLLRACWTLTEMLFSLRQNKLTDQRVDEELLGSAVQACWELCDLFREGWTQIRPDRGTPKPSQHVFPTGVQQQQPPVTSRPSSSLSSTYHSVSSKPVTYNPETPTTIFDERDELSPGEMVVPNILVLGPDPNGQSQSTARKDPNRWSSASSNTDSMSGFSETSSQRTATSVGRSVQSGQSKPHSKVSQSTGSAISSTATPIAAGPPEPENPNLTYIKALILKAALNVGFARQSPSSLPTFVKTLPPTAFGSAPWQVGLLDSYRKLVMTDPTLRGERVGIPVGRKLSAAEIGKAVLWMARGEQFNWLRELYRFVFGFEAGDVVGKKGVFITL